MQDTYICARTSGDRAYLFWLGERLRHVYNESPYTDYVLTLNEFVDYFERRSKVPHWLNWLLRKYDL